jgi:hypothetical protein
MSGRAQLRGTAAIKDLPETNGAALLHLPPAMHLRGVVFIAFTAFCASSAWAADATTAVDLTQRNAPYAPAAGASISAEKQTPETNSTLQQKRVDKVLVDKPLAPLADRRAGVEIKEARDKNVRDKESHRPETLEQPTSAFNQRSASITTKNDTIKPPTVARYQEGLAAASATNMARFPAIGQSTSAKINRFVFRKNPPETAVSGALEPGSGAAAETKTATPAAGGSLIQK